MKLTRDTVLMLDGRAYLILLVPMLIELLIGATARGMTHHVHSQFYPSAYAFKLGKEVAAFHAGILIGFLGWFSLAVQPRWDPPGLTRGDLVWRISVIVAVVVVMTYVTWASVSSEFGLLLHERSPTIRVPRLGRVALLTQGSRGYVHCPHRTSIEFPPSTHRHRLCVDLKTWRELSIGRQVEVLGDQTRYGFLVRQYRIIPIGSTLPERVAWYHSMAVRRAGPAWAGKGLFYSLPGSSMTNRRISPAKWYISGANSGIPEAQDNLGLAFLFGIGVARDAKVATDWFRKAASGGDAAAANNLGVAMATGSGVPRDEKGAAEWIRKAARSGSTTAQYNLGMMYLGGLGMAASPAQAARWFAKAAPHDANAQYELGLLYDQGRGVPRDPATASRWWTRAIDSFRNEQHFPAPVDS